MSKCTKYFVRATESIKEHDIFFGICGNAVDGINFNVAAKKAETLIGAMVQVCERDQAMREIVMHVATAILERDNDRALAAKRAKEAEKNKGQVDLEDSIKEIQNEG